MSRELSSSRFLGSSFAPTSSTTEDTDTNARTNLVHGKTTNSILSAAYKVHSRLGPGLLERPYHACLCCELERLKVPFESEKILPVVYDGLTIQLGYRIDLLVNGEVIVEVKRVGLLINFNVARLRDGIRRRICGY
jgi:hypothetical protein